ncbi:peptidase M24 [Sulfobacillus acidophilus DSM 10332]|uniref:Peptidase M24 n=1 Tax=Sulfobacillus acidophilus (strain ATCC 700253 / DSM 10332 / NAL) TaxID=679936 RepID=G8TUC6_SULAD|nr:peptidase M24 [Sulfobacillus acidophilus DSM 10332]
MFTRLAAIQQQLQKEGSLLWLAPGDDFRYAVGWSPLPDERLTFLVIAPDSAHLVIASVNAEEAVAHLGTAVPMTRFTDEQGPREAVRDVYRKLDGSRWRSFISDDARFDHAQIVAHEAGPLGLASRLMAPLRMEKADDELARLRESQRINDAAMRAAFEAMQVGMTEAELADVIRRAFIREGADREAFIIVAAGEHSALPHHTPGSTVLSPGPVLLDIGCFYQGYASDMTRVAYLGEPDEKFRAVHAIVDRAVQTAVRTARAGVAAESVDRAARRVIQDAGYGEFFVHRTGHGIGLSVHEPPSVMEGNQDPLPLHATYSIEPGIYLPGEFGVRLEEVVVNQADGAEILSQVPRDIFVKPL